VNEEGVDVVGDVAARNGLGSLITCLEMENKIIVTMMLFLLSQTRY
jgi:hypothetical protein